MEQDAIIFTAYRNAANVREDVISGISWFGCRRPRKERLGVRTSQQKHEDPCIGYSNR